MFFALGQTVAAGSGSLINSLTGSQSMNNIDNTLTEGGAIPSVEFSESITS